MLGNRDAGIHETRNILLVESHANVKISAAHNLNGVPIWGTQPEHVGQGRGRSS